MEGLLAKEGVAPRELSHDLQKNPQRMLRFLEKRRMPSEPQDGISWRSERLKFAIDIGRDDRVSRIEARVRRMVDNGWREEVQSLLDSGVPLNAPAFRAIGYKPMAAVVSGSLTLDEAIDQTNVATRQYAKRQLTWLRREPQLHWVDGRGGAESVVDHILNTIKGGSNG
jgi:tRNA dimethylallyltransferase